MLAGTLPAWYHGWANSWLVPPPPPELYFPGGGGVQAPLVSVEYEVCQPYSPSHWRWLPMNTLVPPTPVTRGRSAGKSTVLEARSVPPLVWSPASPLEKFTVMPVSAASVENCS